MSDADDPRTVFLKSLPRKIVEIKATLGAFIADPRSTRMRDELRRRLCALLALARTYDLQGMSEALGAAEQMLDPSRSGVVLGLQGPEIHKLSSFIASLSALSDPTRQRPTVSRSHSPGTLQGFSLPPRTSTLVPVPSLRTSLPPPPNPLRQSSYLPGASSRPAPSSSYSPPSSGFAAAQSVLFVGGRLLSATLRSVLPADMDLVPTDNLSEAMALARDTAPDVILAEADPPAEGPSLLSALRADPLTDFLPVILLADDEDAIEALRLRCPEAAEVLSVTTDVLDIRAALDRALSGSASEVLPDLGELTLEELSRALADEIRRGLVGAAAPRSRSARLSLGSGNEVLSATWEAIARIREVLEKQSRGAVRFELTATPRGLPGTHVFSMGDGLPEDDPRAPAEDPLPGRRALVVDDDSEVVESFTRILTQAGMSVTPCTDGASALASARAHRPDVVISDIVMPGIDGFALCREIQGDSALRHTPVILLSWKDDLLTRMRDLGAQAQGYLRKESPGEAILARVRAVLRARVRLLRRVADLGPSGAVRGRIERVGAVALLEEAARSLRDATVTLADPSSITELELRDGRLVAAVRTALDGGFARGESALTQSLGLPSGRFVVRRNSAPARANLNGELTQLFSLIAKTNAAPESEAPKAEASVSEVPESKVPETEVAETEVPESNVPETLSLKNDEVKYEEIQTFTRIFPDDTRDPESSSPEEQGPEEASESDGLAAAVWRELRGVIDERRPEGLPIAEVQARVLHAPIPEASSLGGRAMEGATQPPPPLEPKGPTERPDTLPAPPLTAVGPRFEEPVQVTDASFDPQKSLKPLTSPPPTPEGSPVTRRAWVRLGLYVALTFAASYMAVRWYNEHQAETSPPPDLRPDPRGLPRPAPSDAGQGQGQGHDVDSEGVDAVRPTEDANSPYVDPTRWLDGGALGADAGLLVVRAERHGASPVEVQVDQRVIGNAPVTLSLSEGLHTLRFRAGIITTYQFVHVRAGSAVLLDAPSDH